MNDGFQPVTAASMGGETPSLGTVPSPCNGVCLIDPGVGLCRGCYRTREEIAAWGRLDDDARRVLRVQLDARRGGRPARPEMSA